MFPHKSSGIVADRSVQAQEASMKSKHVTSGKEFTTDCSVSESGQTESGYLSSTNISSSGTFLSGEITPPSPKTECPEFETDSKSYMRLDSDVGIGLSDHFSELCIEESLNDLSCDCNVKSSSCETYSSKQNVNIPPLNSRTEKEATSESAEDSSLSASSELYFQQDEEGDTQLHIAIIQEFIEVVYSLIRMIPNPTYLDIRNDLRQTGLHLAVLTGQPKIVRTLVCAGARTDIVDRNGNTPLHLATAAGDCNCLRALTDPIKVVETATIGLRYSPYQRPPHLPEIDMFNYEGLTCVHIAVMSGNIDILRHLFWLRADINAREWKSGRTPLHIAVEMEDMNLAEILVMKMGARADITTYSGHTPYRLAKTNPEVITILNRIGIPDESDYSSTDEDEDDAESQLQMMEAAFRNHTNGGIVNATA